MTIANGVFRKFIASLLVHGITLGCMACLWYHQSVSAIPVFQAGEFSLDLAPALPLAPEVAVAASAAPPARAAAEPEAKELDIIQQASETQKAPGALSRNPGAQAAAAPISGTSNPGVPNAPRLDSYMCPVYPPGARLRGEEGAVTVSAVVTPTGKARTAEVVRSSGFPALDQAALNAVQRARFIPAQKGSLPYESQTLLTFRFTLVD